MNNKAMGPLRRLGALLRFAPKMLADTAAVGLGYFRLSHDLPKIPLKQMRNDLKAASAKVEHPFILATGPQFARVRAALAGPEGDAFIKNACAYAMEQAGCLLDTPPCTHCLLDGKRMLEVSREVLNRVVTLGFAWRLTGESRYAKRGWVELARVCGFDDWNTAHFLDTAEMTLAVAVGYDWFFDALTDPQKDLLARKVYEYALKPGDPNNPLRLLRNWWSWFQNNWNSVCFGGLGAACMAFADRYPGYAAKFLRRACYNMPAAVTSFRPDGVYVEGNNYWAYGVSYLVFFIITSRNFFGTDYGLSALPGVGASGDFPLYISSPTGAFNAGDNHSAPPFSPVLFWFASQRREAMLSAYQRRSWHEGLPRPRDAAADGIRQTEPSWRSREFVLSALWYEPAPEDAPARQRLARSVYLRCDEGQEFVLMRSAYFDPNATYAGIKSGYNYTNHGDLDIGTFIYESRGVRWFDDLGPSDYNLTGYFVGFVFGGRWKNYRKRAEGHNTLVINPAMAAEDQYPYARTHFSSFADDTAVLDMTQAYIRNGVKSVTREFRMLPRYAGIRVTDRVACRRESEIYWFAHTTAEIALAADGKSAVLRKDGKSIAAALDAGGNAVFSVMEALPLPGSPARIDTGENKGFRKLAVHLEHVKEAVITVTVTEM